MAVEAKEGIVGSAGAGGSIAVDEELVEVGAGGVGRPGCAGGFGPAGDDAAAADDGVLAVCSLPDGVAVLGAEVERLGEKICSGVNGDGDGAGCARAALGACCIPGLG